MRENFRLWSGFCVALHADMSRETKENCGIFVGLFFGKQNSWFYGNFEDFNPFLAVIGYEIERDRN